MLLSYSRVQLHNDAPVALGRPDMRCLCNLLRSHEALHAAARFNIKPRLKQSPVNKGKVHLTADGRATHPMNATSEYLVFRQHDSGLEDGHGPSSIIASLSMALSS